MNIDRYWKVVLHDGSFMIEHEQVSIRGEHPQLNYTYFGTKEQQRWLTNVRKNFFGRVTRPEVLSRVECTPQDIARALGEFL